MNSYGRLEETQHLHLQQQDDYAIIIIFNLSTAAFKAYCAIWVKRSNFRHQASPRVSPLESTQRRKVELWARNVRQFCLNADLHVTFRDLLHAVKLRHGTDGFTSPPKEGMLRIFFLPKNPTASNGCEHPQTWIPKASTLPLYYRSRYDCDMFFRNVGTYLQIEMSLNQRIPESSPSRWFL